MSTGQNPTGNAPAPAGPVQPPPRGTGGWAKVVFRWLVLFGGMGIGSWLAYEIAELVKNADHLRTGKLILNPIAYNDGTKAAITQRVDSAKVTSQTGLIILAALWGLFLAKKRGERFLTLTRIDDMPENILFWIATVALAGVWYSSSEYVDAMAVIQTKVAKVTDSEPPPPAPGKQEANEWHARFDFVTGRVVIAGGKPDAKDEWVIPDFTNEKIDGLVRSQTLLFVTGTILAGWVLYSTHLLKEDSP